MALFLMSYESAHPVRLKIMELLLKKGTMLQADIVRQLQGTEFEKEFRTIQTYFKKMESSGIVEINKDKNDLTIVVLKKRIEIFVGDV